MEIITICLGLGLVVESALLAKDAYDVDRDSVFGLVVEELAKLPRSVCDSSGTHRGSLCSIHVDACCEIKSKENCKARTADASDPEVSCNKPS